MNESENIADCLSSLEAQTRGADEIIVVDNESEDDTVEIARSYGVKVLSYPRESQYMGNLGLQRQMGTEAATGDIVVSTDADCLYPSEWLQKIEAHFTMNPKLVLLGGPCYNAAKNDLHGDLMIGWMNFARSYQAGWGIPHFLGANTSFRRDAFLVTEGYKGFAAHGPSKEFVFSFRLARVGEWLWSDDVYCFTKVPLRWRVHSVALPLSVAPLGAWAGACAIQGMM